MLTKIVPIIFLALVITMMAIVPTRNAYATTYTGWENTVFHPVVSAGEIKSPLDNLITVSTAIAGTSSPYFCCVPYCSPVYGTWSDQNNWLQDASYTYSWIQEGVVVAGPAEGGNSCFTVEFWPDYYTSNTPDSYGSNIGYSSSFYNKGATIEFQIFGTPVSCTTYCAQITSFYVSTLSDEWKITPGELTPQHPNEYYDQGSQANFIMVGNGGGTTADFTSGAGTMKYCSSTPNLNEGEIQSGENSNMQYATPSSDGACWLQSISS
jgi:hypothetical protein